MKSMMFVCGLALVGLFCVPAKAEINVEIIKDGKCVVNDAKCSCLNIARAEIRKLRNIIGKERFCVRRYNELVPRFEKDRKCCKCCKHCCKHGQKKHFRKHRMGIAV
jgi:hypothetical protein